MTAFEALLNGAPFWLCGAIVGLVFGRDWGLRGKWKFIDQRLKAERDETVQLSLGRICGISVYASADDWPALTRALVLAGGKTRESGDAGEWLDRQMHD